MVLILLALLGACAQSPNEPLPNLELEALDYWWATTPDVIFPPSGTLHLSFTLRNVSGSTMTFDGSKGGADPADGLQFWTVPDVGLPSLDFTEFPEGDYADGETVEWEFAVDLAAFPSGQTGVAIRPYSTQFGTTGPGSLELVTSQGQVVD